MRAAVTDRVRIFDGKAWTEHEAEHFFRLPQAKRVRHVLDRTVVFLRHGQERDVRAVLTERNLDVPGDAATDAPPKADGPTERAPTRRLRSVK